MIWDLERAARDADIALAALDQTGVPFQVGGDVALARHRALQRQAREISLTTPVTHSTDRSRDVLQGALAHLGYRVRVEQGQGHQGPFRAMTYLPPDGTPDAADAHAVRLTISVKPQYNAPVALDGLRVSSMTTLSVQTLQAVQSRMDPRDFIDLVAQEQHYGRQAFAKLTDQVLRRAVQDQSPRMNPVEPYIRLHRSLLYIQHVPNIQFARLNVGEGQVQQIRSAIRAMAERVLVSLPRPRPEPDGADVALDRLRALSPGQRSALPSRMAEPEARAALAGRHPSAVPPPPPLPPPTVQPVRPAAADSQRVHQRGTPSQHPGQTR
ncbi:hypothetical protein [Streptomyces sp. S1D4-20]|uniref:hypothetical protein n=1 Tax=Streptomyces sp. S1D4-20 TaxID=2594462 RepID=UPI0011642387|nr:hypothetical protein [Streptomyces sp. S1D4-20]QDN54202.1 hypothetical protein FNV67_01125 [Streptomyces sp. S1D4-20]